MSILNDIRKCFASAIIGQIRPLLSLPSKYIAYVYRDNDSYGVIIPYDGKVIFEKFSGAKISVIELNIENKLNKMLYLSSKNYSLRNEFALICQHFVDPGVGGEKRKGILEDPFEWWNSWSKLLGNIDSKKSSYSVLGELHVLNDLFKKDKTIEWTAIYNGTHDFESKENSYEVKSTLKKYDLFITISSQNQLFSNKPLYLYFCRFERDPFGVSINDVVDKLIMNGYHRPKLENELSKIGYEIGKSIRDEKYHIYDKRKFLIDDNFPRLSTLDIINEDVKKKIVKLEYTIDLSGIDYKRW